MTLRINPILQKIFLVHAYLLSRIGVSCPAINHLQINSYLYFIQFGIDLSPIENYYVITPNLEWTESNRIEPDRSILSELDPIYVYSISFHTFHHLRVSTQGT